MLINPSQRRQWRMSCMSCNLRVSFLATPYPQLSWAVGCLPVTTGSGAVALFLRRNHSFCHPTDGLEIERWKYGMIPGLVRT
jgi:hypothetical protein